MELPEKIESALVAYLQAQITAALAPEVSFDPATQIHAGETDQDIDRQIIACVCDDAESEYPLGTGNFWFPININLITPVGLLTESEVGAVTPLELHRSLAGLLADAIMRDDLVAQLTAAAADFTCLGLLDRRPQRAQDNSLYLSGFTFRLYAASMAMV